MFISLYNKDLARKGNHLMIQRTEVASKSFPEGKTQEQKENEEMSLFNALNPGDAVLA